MPKSFFSAPWTCQTSWTRDMPNLGPGHPGPDTYPTWTRSMPKLDPGHGSADPEGHQRQILALGFEFNANMSPTTPQSANQRQQKQKQSLALDSTPKWNSTLKWCHFWHSPNWFGIGSGRIHRFGHGFNTKLISTPKYIFGIRMRIATRSVQTTLPPRTHPLATT